MTMKKEHNVNSFSVTDLNLK